MLCEVKATKAKWGNLEKPYRTRISANSEGFKNASYNVLLSDGDALFEILS